MGKFTDVAARALDIMIEVLSQYSENLDGDNQIYIINIVEEYL